MEKQIEDLKQQVINCLKINSELVCTNARVLAVALEIEGCCEHCGKLLKEGPRPGHYYQCECRG